MNKIQKKRKKNSSKNNQTWKYYIKNKSMNKIKSEKTLKINL